MGCWRPVKWLLNVALCIGIEFNDAGLCETSGDELEFAFCSCAIWGVFQKCDGGHESVEFGCVGGCDLAPTEIRRGFEPAMLYAVLEEKTGYGCRWIE